MYQILQKFDIHWHDGGPSIAMMYHLRRVSDLLCNWKSCLLCYKKDVVLHCSIFFKWNKLVRVRVRVREMSYLLEVVKSHGFADLSTTIICNNTKMDIEKKRYAPLCKEWSYLSFPLLLLKFHVSVVCHESTLIRLYNCLSITFCAFFFSKWLIIDWYC